MSTKKYKIGFSFWNLLTPTSEEVVKLQTIWTGFAVSIVGSAFIVSSDRNTLIATIACGVIDKLLACLSIEKLIPKIKE